MIFKSKSIKMPSSQIRMKRNKINDNTIQFS